MHASSVHSHGRRRAFCLVSVFLLAAAATPLRATLDRNHDGVSDLWARAYPTAGAPEADPDGDGATNLAEALAGTNPLDPASRFQAAPQTDATGQIELRWAGQPGKHYNIESSPDLLTWGYKAGNLAGSGTNLSWTVHPVDTAAPAREFWRVNVWDADTDTDLLTDWEEAQLGTSPTLTDTDLDGLPEAWEATFALNPLINDAAADPDGDGFTNAVEYAAGTDPTYHALPVSGGPVAFWVSQPIRPDETMLITAGGIDIGAQLDLAALPNGDPGSPLDPAAPPSNWTEVRVLTATPRSVTATVPATWSSGLYALRLRQGSATGPTRLVNAPDPWFVQGDRGDTATPGGFFIVAGTCLDQPGGVGPRAALVSNGSVVATLAFQDSLTTSTGYALRFAVPADMPEGDYTLYLHNGCGGPAGWVRFKTFVTAPVETVTIRKPVVWPDIDYAVSPPTGATDDALFATAIAQAESRGGGRIRVPAGTYTLTQQLALPHRTILQGSGLKQTLIRWNVDPGKALVVGKALPPPHLGGGHACFALEDLSLEAAPDSRLHIIERIDTSEYGWIRRVGVKAASSGFLADWDSAPTAIYVSWANNTVLEDLELDSYVCVQAGARTTYLRLVNSTLDWYAKSFGVHARSHNLVVANNRMNQRENTAGLDVGMVFTSDYGDWYMAGPFTRDLLWARNTSLSDPSTSHMGGYTSDSPSGIYLGKIESAEGTGLTLAGATRVPLDPTGMPVYSYNWAGGIAQILGGRGAGQWRYLRDTTPGMHTVQVDRPWDIDPDATSTVGLVNLQGRLMIIDNDFAQEPESQDFYLTLDVLKAGNKFGIEGGDASITSWSGFDLQCAAPAWHTQVLDNTLVRGLAIFYSSMVINLERADYSGVVGAGHVYRNNKNSTSGSATLYLGSRDNDFADVVIERNHLDGIQLRQPNSSERIALSGVLFRANTTAAGAPTPTLPVEAPPGLTVAP